AIAPTQGQQAPELEYAGEQAGPPAEDSKLKTQNSKLKTQAPLVPTWDHELELFSQGYGLLAGVDEAGRGAWAGPLVAAAVIFPAEAVEEARCAAGRYGELARLRDSKLLSPCVREQLLECARSAAL